MAISALAVFSLHTSKALQCIQTAVVQKPRYCQELQSAYAVDILSRDVYRNYTLHPKQPHRSAGPCISRRRAISWCSPNIFRASYANPQGNGPYTLVQAKTSVAVPLGSPRTKAMRTPQSRWGRKEAYTWGLHTSKLPGARAMFCRSVFL